MEKPWATETQRQQAIAETLESTPTNLDMIVDKAYHKLQLTWQAQSGTEPATTPLQVAHDDGIHSHLALTSCKIQEVLQEATEK